MKRAERCPGIGNIGAKKEPFNVELQAFGEKNCLKIVYKTDFSTILYNPEKIKLFPARSQKYRNLPLPKTGHYAEGVEYFCARGQSYSFCIGGFDCEYPIL